MGDLKTLRTFLAERLDDLDEGVLPSNAALAAVVGDAVMAVRDWLAQPEILVLIASGLAESGTVEGAALALRRAAVQ